MEDRLGSCSGWWLTRHKSLEEKMKASHKRVSAVLFTKNHSDLAWHIIPKSSHGSHAAMSSQRQDKEHVLPFWESKQLGTSSQNQATALMRACPARNKTKNMSCHFRRAYRL